MQGGPLSPDEYRVASPPALLHQPAPVIVVAIDRDRNSQLAAKWVVDHLLSGASQIVLLHVAAHYPANHGFAMAETTQSALEAEMKEIFVPYRGFFNRNGVDVFEVVLEEADVSKAILGYITANKIQSIALGGASRNAFTKKFKNADVPSTLMKCAPDYCNIYVVAKGKSVNVRLAKCGVPPMHGGADSPSDTDSVRESGLYIRRGSRGHGHLPPVMPDARRSMDGRSTLPELTTRPPFRERSLPSSATKNVVVLPGKDYSEAPSRSARHDSFGGDLDFGPSTRFSSMDFGDNLDLTASPAREPMSPATGAQRDIEVEMRRLRLELKQTMDMYNAACKEAINAKQRAKEMQLMKLEEERRLEEARHAEETALALAEMEKAKCRAAMEAAEAAQRLADLEAQRRRNAEVRARREADEKVRALDAISNHDFRYRKYHIDEIEMATERFSDELKIGEGGYGPVYRASLDHTPVAIKTGKLGVKSDIYSLGVLLLQVVTARPPMGLTHHVEKAIDAGTFAQMLDITVKDWPVEEALGYAKLALKCTEMRRRDRPDLATVVLPELNRLRNLGHAYEARMSAVGTNSGSGESNDQVSGSSPTAGGSWRTAES
ncbi:Protein kinase protein with adenine nucleotide alpha hydrolase-like domain [Zea mays]|uniref:RING-type E3 ubiquitin transferase n=1 Tax=Zea mays TaxID=4577 RepID=A0A1D6NKJ2_MAIZE|nr:Protein kinase protein with adenine nucleotide alpha hydrolase-like domain [Zea mays]